MATRKRMIATAKDAIRALGGPTAVAEWLNLDQSTISGWGTRGAIGRGWEMFIYQSLRDRKYTQDQIAPKVFGIDDWSQLVMPKQRLKRAA